MKHRFLLPFLILFGLLSAATANADTSTRGCITNTMKAGFFCNWSEAKSWCNNNTNACEVENQTACPGNPTGGTWAFSCNVNTCVLTCTTGYTLCTGTCHVNVTIPNNCTSFNQCTDTCSACAQGYELVGGICIGATLKLGSDSVGALNHIFQSTSPSLYVLSSGFVGVGLTNPTASLQVAPASGTYGILAGGTPLTAYRIGNLDDPSADDDAATKYYVDHLLGGAGSYLPISGGAMTGAIDMGNNNISNINKLTATTIDPLYTIKGINYATFVSSVAGGVKEEYIGKIKISKLNAAKEYEAVINFSAVEEGSDLWVWHQVIDFNKDSVDVVITPYGKFAQVYYVIDNNKLIFRSDRAVEISYRLIAKRFDWRDWPTRSQDQTTPGVKIKFKPLINLNNLINKLNIRTFQIF